MPATTVVEGTLWLIALVVYIRATRARKRTGIYVFWAMIAFLTLSWVNNIMATPPAGNLTVASMASLTFSRYWWRGRIGWTVSAGRPRILEREIAAGKGLGIRCRLVKNAKLLLLFAWREMNCWLHGHALKYAQDFRA